MACCDQPHSFSSTLCRCGALRSGVTLVEPWEVEECLGGGRQSRAYHLRNRDDTAEALHAMEYVLIGAGRSVPLAQAVEEELTRRVAWEHAGLPRVYGQFHSSTLPRWYLLTEWVNGDALRYLVEETGTPGLPLAQVETSAASLLGLLEYVHSHSSEPLGNLSLDSLVRRRSNWEIVHTRYSPIVLRPAVPSQPSQSDRAESGALAEDLAAVGRIILAMLSGNLCAADPEAMSPDAWAALLETQAVNGDVMDVVRRSQLSPAGGGFADARAMREALIGRRRAPKRKQASARQWVPSGDVMPPERVGGVLPSAAPVVQAAGPPPVVPLAPQVSVVPDAFHKGRGSGVVPAPTVLPRAATPAVSLVPPKPDCEWTELPLLPHGRLRIFIPAELYREIIGEVTEAASRERPVSTYREAGGLLIGRVQRIDGVWQVSVESHRSLDAREDGTFTLSRSEWIEVEAMLSQSGAVQVLVGVYHSHPGMGLFQNPADRLYLGEPGQCLLQPWHFSLLLDPLTSMSTGGRGCAGVFLNGAQIGAFAMAAPLGEDPSDSPSVSARLPSVAGPSGSSKHGPTRSGRKSSRRPLLILTGLGGTLLLGVAAGLVWKPPAWIGVQPADAELRSSEPFVAITSVAVGADLIPEIECVWRNLRDSARTELLVGLPGETTRLVLEAHPWKRRTPTGTPSDTGKPSPQGSRLLILRTTQALPPAAAYTFRVRVWGRNGGIAAESTEHSLQTRKPPSSEGASGLPCNRALISQRTRLRLPAT